MLTYREILDAKVGSIQTQIKGWNKVKTKLDTTKKTAAGVRTDIRDGDWKGKSEQAADDKAGFLNSQVKAARSEVKAIKLILWQAKHLFGEYQTLLQDITKRIQDHPYLKIDNQGKVEVDLSGTNALGVGGGDGSMLVALVQMAEETNESIKKLCKQVTTIDNDVAKALRAASNLGDKSELDFNADAMKDGHISLKKYLYGQYKLDYHFPDWMVRKYPGDNDERTPQEVLAALGLVATGKFDDVQNAHKVADKYGYQEGGIHNGRGDAMKHAMLAAMVSRDAGEGNARLLLDGHERKPDNPVNEEVMDRHNNEIGYRIAREHPDASNEELARLIRKEMNAGNTLTIDEKTGEIEYTGEPD